MSDRIGSALLIAALLLWVRVGAASAEGVGSGRSDALPAVLRDFNTPQSTGQQGRGCATTSNAGPITGGAAGQAAFVALSSALLMRRHRRRADAALS